MSLLNRASFLTSLISAKIQNKAKPLTVIYNITDRCNAGCKYCYLRYYDRGSRDPNTEQVLKVIDELAELGAKRISFGGGEPLMHPGIEQIVKRVKLHSLDCVMNSNGLIVPEKIDLLKQTDAICISLDGPKEIHDQHRGDGSYDGAMAGIKAAKQAGLTVHTNTVLGRDSLKAIDYVLKLAKEIGFLAEFNLMVGYRSGEDGQHGLKAQDKELKSAVKKIIELKQKGEPILMSKVAYEYSYAWPSYEIEEIKATSASFSNPLSPPDSSPLVRGSKKKVKRGRFLKCYAGKYFCVIDTDGRVYACPHLIGKQKVKNCYEIGFKKAFTDLFKHDCRACYQVYHNEFNLLFGLDLRVIMNHIRNSFKKKFK